MLALRLTRALDGLLCRAVDVRNVEGEALLASLAEQLESWPVSTAELDEGAGRELRGLREGSARLEGADAATPPPVPPRHRHAAAGAADRPADPTAMPPASALAKPRWAERSARAHVRGGADDDAAAAEASASGGGQRKPAPVHFVDEGGHSPQQLVTGARAGEALSSRLVQGERMAPRAARDGDGSGGTLVDGVPAGLVADDEAVEVAALARRMRAALGDELGAVSGGLDDEWNAMAHMMAQRLHSRRRGRRSMPWAFAFLLPLIVLVSSAVLAYAMAGDAARATPTSAHPQTGGNGSGKSSGKSSGRGRFGKLLSSMQRPGGTPWLGRR